MKSPYDARQERERANSGRIQILLDAADYVTTKPGAAPPFHVYPGEVARAGGIEIYTYHEIQFAVQRMQAAGWVAEFVDSRDGAFIRLTEPNPPREAIEHFRIPGRD